jgi:hypothetical protein
MAFLRPRLPLAAGLAAAIGFGAAGCQGSPEGSPRADSQATAPTAGANAAAFMATGLAGESVDLLANPAAPATVLVFMRSDCPISNRFAPEINRLAEEFGPRKVAFWRVYPAAADTADFVRRHTEEYRLAPPAALDAERRLARALEVSVTPEAVALAPGGKVLYRGRIDDRFVDYGKARAEPSRRDLAEALEEALAGRPVSTPETQAIGCPLEGRP